MCAKTGHWCLPVSCTGLTNACVAMGIMLVLSCSRILQERWPPEEKTMKGNLNGQKWHENIENRAVGNKIANLPRFRIGYLELKKEEPARATNWGNKDDANWLDMQEHQGVGTRAKTKQLKSHRDQLEQEKFRGLNFDVQDLIGLKF
ncbi:hypothetical protein M9H77_29514 [Catharanthus roseus]|uniref:Uncharacterized protein n=1 Tax=Catharanthus roseus TaxID=4058 RepID=A0ACB9ZVY4_CATRO|nr:hypothetical protein M9H77_29514 [Catharanthus roseus]